MSSINPLESSRPGDLSPDSGLDITIRFSIETAEPVWSDFLLLEMQDLQLRSPDRVHKYACNAGFVKNENSCPSLTSAPITTVSENSGQDAPYIVNGRVPVNRESTLQYEHRPHINIVEEVSKPLPFLSPVSNRMCFPEHEPSDAPLGSLDEQPASNNVEPSTICRADWNFPAQFKLLEDQRQMGSISPKDYQLPIAYLNLEQQKMKGRMMAEEELQHTLPAVPLSPSVAVENHPNPDLPMKPDSFKTMVNNQRIAIQRPQWSAIPRLGPFNGDGPSPAVAQADYQMQLMLLEQQNRKRLMMARKEQLERAKAEALDCPADPVRNNPVL